MGRSDGFRGLEQGPGELFASCAQDVIELVNKVTVPDHGRLLFQGSLAQSDFNNIRVIVDGLRVVHRVECVGDFGPVDVDNLKVVDGLWLSTSFPPLSVVVDSDDVVVRVAGGGSIGWCKVVDGASAVDVYDVAVVLQKVLPIPVCLTFLPPTVVDGDDVIVRVAGGGSVGWFKVVDGASAIDIYDIIVVLYAKVLVPLPSRFSLVTKSWNDNRCVPVSKAIVIVSYGTVSILDTRCCLLYTSPSPRDRQKSRMQSSA